LKVALNAHFFHHPGTGSGQYLSHLIRAFEARVAPVEPLPVFRPAAGNVRKVWWEQVLFPRLAAASGAPVWHVPYFAPPLMHARPVVTTIHDVIQLVFPEYATAPLVRLYNRLVAMGARRAEAILADSEASKRDIVRLLGVSEARVRVVYLAPDESVSRSVSSAEIVMLRQKYRLAERYVLYYGGLLKHKNVAALLRAFAELQDLDVQLAISGAVRNTELPQLAEGLGIADRVRFIGFAPDEDKPALLRGAACFAYPSLYEGFGLNPLEALACGTPVVCSNRSSLPELMGNAALMVDPGEEGSLSEALRRVLADAALRADLVARGPAQAAKFSWQRCARETYEAYVACAS
jgi:glycosyltransferase involved in cell wall biosynthesis